METMTDNIMADIIEEVLFAFTSNDELAVKEDLKQIVDGLLHKIETGECKRHYWVNISRGHDPIQQCMFCGRTI